jgi:hypothetical protein
MSFRRLFTIHLTLFRVFSPQVVVVVVEEELKEVFKIPTHSRMESNSDEGILYSISLSTKRVLQIQERKRSQNDREKMHLLALGR